MFNFREETVTEEDKNKELQLKEEIDKITSLLKEESEKLGRYKLEHHNITTKIKELYDRNAEQRKKRQKIIEDVKNERKVWDKYNYRLKCLKYLSDLGVTLDAEEEIATDDIITEAHLRKIYHVFSEDLMEEYATYDEYRNMYINSIKYNTDFISVGPLVYSDKRTYQYVMSIQNINSFEWSAFRIDDSDDKIQNLSYKHKY